LALLDLEIITKLTHMSNPHITRLNNIHTLIITVFTYRIIIFPIVHMYLWYSFFHVIGLTGYGLVWNFPKKFAAKSSAERAWQTTVNKNSTMMQYQRLNSNDRDRNVYLAFLLMRQKQDTILVMLEYYARSTTFARKKKENRTFVLMESVDRKHA